MLFLQGGALLQFGMVPMNLLRGTGKSADYIVTGTWSKKARDEAKTQGTGPRGLGRQGRQLQPRAQAERVEARPQRRLRLHLPPTRRSRACSIPTSPDVGDVPLVCDASSDFLSPARADREVRHPLRLRQKNAGPAGVTIVIIRDDLVARSPADLPSMVNYKVLAEGKSLLNTPPTFAIYMVKLVTDWLLNEIGGLEKMAEINRGKAKMLYDVIDGSSGFYQGHAEPASRSMMNVPFRLANPAHDEPFLKQAAERGLFELKGHRSVGGCRASIYNAMPVEGVQAAGRLHAGVFREEPIAAQGGQSHFRGDRTHFQREIIGAAKIGTVPCVKT